MRNKSNVIVISLGGSVFTGEGTVRVSFLKAFKKCLLSLVQQRMCFVVVIGGGEVCRTYQDHARKAGVKSSRDLDWIGIYATRLNAALVKSIFGSNTTDDLSYGNLKRQLRTHPVLVLGGTAPGGSSDRAMVALAREVGARKVFNLSNITYVYDKDPRKHKDAQPFKQLTWGEYTVIIGGKRVPGGNYPFDPAAARLAERQSMEVVIMDGRRLAEVKKALTGKPFIGTIIKA
ncbi:MAG TPA: UMP kinase [Candidatus Magasanikbacteria bacterium]|nr:UMP kinase [Candidatus Magasanikbacteria bacterium]